MTIISGSNAKANKSASFSSFLEYHAIGRLTRTVLNNQKLKPKTGRLLISPILEGYEWCLGNDCGAYAEGMAETIAKFIENEEWLRNYSEITDEEIANKKSVIKYGIQSN